jgi:hypothetical protein
MIMRSVTVLFVLAFALGFSEPAFAVIAFVQSSPEYRVAGNVASGASTFATAPKSGNTVIVYVAGYQAGVLSASDNQGNTYSVAAHMENGNFSVAILYATNISYSAGSFTVTVAGASSGYLTFAAAEYSGLAKVNVFDQQSCNMANSATPTAGPTAMTVQGPELLAAVFDNETTSNDAIGMPSGFTSVWTENDASYNTGAGGHRIVNVRGTYSAVFTSNQTINNYACVATFRAAPGPTGYPIMQ